LSAKGEMDYLVEINVEINLDLEVAKKNTIAQNKIHHYPFPIYYSSQQQVSSTIWQL
jgi:hypothetical protein